MQTETCEDVTSMTIQGWLTVALAAAFALLGVVTCAILAGVK